MLKGAEIVLNVLHVSAMKKRRKHSSSFSADRTRLRLFVAPECCINELNLGFFSLWFFCDTMNHSSSFLPSSVSTYRCVGLFGESGCVILITPISKSVSR